MPTRKGGSKPKFTGDLAKPIVMPFRLPDIGDDGSLRFADPQAEEGAIYAALALPKLKLLLEHYNVDEAGEGKWFSLCLQMASDLVPGFKVASEDPFAAYLGWPMAGGSKSNRRMESPMLWGARLLALVEMLKKHQGLESDAACAEKLFDELWEKPRGRIPKTYRASKIATIKARIVTARRA